MKKLVMSCVAIVGCLSLMFAQGGNEQSGSGSGAASKSYTINVASTFAPEGPVHEVMTEFQKNVQDASSGRIKVVVHPSGALGGVREVCEGLNAGTIEMGAIGFEDLTYYAPEYAFFEYPYLIRDLDHYKKVLNEFGPEIFAAAQKKSGIITSAYFIRGARAITANKPIVHPADLKGLKFRLPSLPVRVKVFEAFGASPTIVDFAELYMALKTGTVDAQENPPETIYSYKYYETQKYLMLSHHIYTVARYITSEKWFNTISKEDQDMISKAWKDAQDKVSAEYPDPDAVYVQRCKDAGMEIVEPNNEEFIEIATPVVLEFAKANCAPGWVEKIQNLK